MLFYEQNFYKQHLAKTGKKIKQKLSNTLTLTWVEGNKTCKQKTKNVSVLIRLSN